MNQPIWLRTRRGQAALHYRGVALAWLWLAFLLTSAKAYGVPPQSNATFLATLGVRTGMSYPDTPYNDTASLCRAIRYLGLETIRDGVPNLDDPALAAAYHQVASSGIRFDFVIHGGGEVALTQELARLRRFVEAHPTAIAAIEGPNEINYWPISYRGITNTYAAAVAVTKDLWAGAKADPYLRGVPIYAPTLAVDRSGELKLGDLSAYVDYGNAHVYAAGGTNIWTNDMPYWLPVQARPTPGKPMVVTETGYTMDGVNVDETVGAKYILNTLFGNALNGIAMTYIFELVDMDPHRFDGRLGLFRSDWSPKPAATTLHNLTSILTEAGPGSPAVSQAPDVRGLPPTGHSMTLGSSTATDVVLWNESTIWNSKSQRAINELPTRVTLNLDAEAPFVEVFDPIAGTLPVEIRRNVRTLSVDVPDHPVIVRVRQTQPERGAGGAR